MKLQRASLGLGCSSIMVATGENTRKQSNLLTSQLVTPSGHRELGQTEGKVSTVGMESWTIELAKQENVTTQEAFPVASEPGMDTGNTVPLLTLAPRCKKGSKLK